MTHPVLYVIGELDYESHETLRLSVERAGRTGSQLIRGEFPPAPVSASRHSGSRETDYTDMSIRVVTEPFRAAVMRHGLTGATFAPLVVDGNQGHWFLMGVTGRCGPFDYSGSVRFERVIRQATGGEWREPYLRGFAIDPASWSGDDFVLPPRVDQVIVTQRVVDTLESEPLTNVRFTPISDYEISERTVRRSVRSRAS